VRHDDEVMGSSRLHQSIEPRQKPVKKSRLFLSWKIGGLDRAVHAGRHLSNAPGLVGAEIPGGLFLVFVDLALSELGEHFVAFVFEQQGLAAVADDDPIAMIYFSCVPAKTGEPALATPKAW
jgi:hypothetical protein